MKQYIDGFILPIPKRRLPEYQAIAEAASEIWKDHGALEYRECVGDDLNTECTRTFADMTGAKDDETVIFAWAVFASREARDAANSKICADPRMAPLVARLTDPESPIVDHRRMAHGGFREIVRG